MTNIPWTDESWNPWVGCQMVSSGCANCYMFREQNRWGNDPTLIRRTSDATFYKPLKLHDKWIFTCSWSDFFIEKADPWRDEAWEIIEKTDNRYQILTKRINRATWPEVYPNVWLGVTVEDQVYDWRLHELYKYPGKRFVSLEPLLGPIDIHKYLTQDGYSGIDWVIVGGESGPNHREIRVEWIEDIAQQVLDSKARLFVKQDSGLYPGEQGRIPDDLWSIKEMPCT